ncbi:glycosyltransferase [Agathobaculum desmolans]|uniref:glycosyltransferase n=1 Tax=Agathobaculum desmolans TaxID=39484 RepID=UPI0004E1496A|nr:glycosyltransferase [Agathobaculum desmolans]
MGKELTKGLFSIAIVSYNQADLIYDCIDSILEQKYPAIELIIADDHSYDFDQVKLTEYIEKNCHENLVRYQVYTNPQNLGIVKNCNIACAHAKGEYLKTIAADDSFADKLVFQRMAKKLQDPRNGIVCARGKAIQHTGESTEDRYPSDIDFQALLQIPDTNELYRYMVTRPWSPIFAPAVFWRNELFQSIGGYDESYVFTEDWPCWIRLAKEKIPFCFVDDFVVKYRYGGISNQSLDGMPNLLRKIHYKECVRALREEYENVRQKYSKGSALRCWYCAEAIEMKSVLELDWYEMSFMQKLRFRMKKLPVLSYIKLMSAINYNKWFHIKREMFVAVIFMILLLTDRQLLPICDLTVPMAWATLVLLSIIGIKMVCNMLLFVLKKRAMLKTMLSGR